MYFQIISNPCDSSDSSEYVDELESTLAPSILGLYVGKTLPADVFPERVISSILERSETGKPLSEYSPA